MNKKIDWTRLALDRGFISTKRMLIELYYTYDLSLMMIAKRLNISYKSVHLKMIELQLPRRERKPSGKFTNIICPNCGHRGSEVVGGRPLENGSYKRRRQCLKCNERMTTREMIVESI